MKVSAGIGGSIHDFASCLVVDGSPLIAIEDERLTRVRYALHSSNSCQPSFRYCLDFGHIKRTDIDEIIANDMLESSIDPQVFPHCTFINHHLTHAYSTFFTSPFDHAAILVVDGAGSLIPSTASHDERETTTFAIGNGNQVSIVSRVIGYSSGERYTEDLPPLMCNSLGDFYRVITEMIGFGFLQAGKTMGLSSYGVDRFVPDILRYVSFLPEGRFEILAGGERGLLRALQQLRERLLTDQDLFTFNADIAASGQTVLELLFTHMLDFLASVADTPNLCLAGGVALNSLVNAKIPTMSKFKNVHVFFAPGDSGTAIGAAIWGDLRHCSSMDTPIRYPISPYLGHSYTDEDILSAIRAADIHYHRSPDIYHETASLLAKGFTVGWYQGGSEFGPRALGNRSILADPRSAALRDHINHNIKKREWFRPLAPVVLSEDVETYFEAHCSSPWMQFVWPVRKEFRSILAGITHKDGGARVQSVSHSENAALSLLLEAYRQTSGFPILLNTSLNIRGEPIVETPGEAIWSFCNSALDVLVLGNFLLSKVS